MAKNTSNIVDRKQLQNVLGINLQKVVTSNKTLSVKAQVMKDVNQKMHELLCKDYPQYYKHISADIVTTSKSGEHTLKQVSGYFLLFPKQCSFTTSDGKTITQDGFQIAKPTTYVKGANSMDCLYYNEIGKTTIKN